jgi:TP901 family phage tail tape measure protein
MAVRRLDLIITSNATAALRGFASLEGAAKRMENRFGAAGRAMFNIGVVGAAGVAIFTAKSVKAFIGFDDAMVRSTAILDNISGPVRKRLEDAAKSVARVTTFSATEAAEAYYGLFSAGLSAEQSISALPVVAQFAQAGLMDLATATDYLVNSQAALGLRMEDPIANMQQMQRVADVLTETNNLATGTVEEFADALTHKAGGALKTVNKDIEEGAAALAYLAEQGVRGSRAGESLAIFIRDVSRAAGNASFRDAFRKFGIDVFTAEGNLKNLADVVAEFETALGPMNDRQRAVALEQLGLTRSVGDVIRQLMGGSESIRDFEEALRSAGGATQSVADKQMESLKAKLEVLKNRMDVLMIEFGEPVAIWLVNVFMPWFETVFLPAMREMATVIREDLKPAFDVVAKALDNPTFVKALSAFTGYVVAFNVLARITDVFKVALGFLLKPIGKLLGLLWKVLAPILRAIIPLFRLLAFAVSALASALGLPVALVVAIIAAIVLAVAAIIIWRDQIWDATRAVGRFFVRLWDDIYSGFIDPIINFFTGPFIDFWKAVWDTAKDLFGRFVSILKIYLTILVGIFAVPLIIIGGIVVAFVKSIIKIFTMAWPFIFNVISQTWDNIVRVTTAIWERWIFPFLRGAVNIAWLIIRIAFKLIEITIVGTWQIVRDSTVWLWGLITGALLAAWHTIRDRVVKPLTDVWNDTVMPKLRSFWEGLQRLWSMIKDVFNNSWAWIRDNVAKPLGDYWNEKVGPKLTAFRDMLSSIWESIKSTAASVWGRILSAIRTPVNGIISVVNVLIDGMNTVIGLINSIPGVDIPKIPLIPLVRTGQAGGSGGSEPTLRAGAHAMGTYDLAKRGPFKTTGPRAIVGEGDPRWPEYVIPTDPRYRGRANSLFAGLASDLGMGFQFGGIIDSVKGGIKSAIDAAGGWFGDFARGALKTAFSPINQAAKSGLDRLPNVFKVRDIAQGFRELIWRVVSGADEAFPETSGKAIGTIGSGAGLRGDSAANRRLGQQLNAYRGWSQYWNDLDALVMSESGWNNTAQNPTSTAYGIGQFLNSTWAGVGYSKTSDPRIQILAMLEYILQRYGNPAKAWQFKKANNWYEAGGMLPGYANGLYRVPQDDFPARLHKDEMVLKAASADAVRDALEGRGNGGMNVRIDNFSIHIDGAGSIEDARRKARAAGKAFLDVLEERKVLTDARIS